jgi:Sigma-70, region 4
VPELAVAMGESCEDVVDSLDAALGYAMAWIDLPESASQGVAGPGQDGARVAASSRDAFAVVFALLENRAKQVLLMRFLRQMSHVQIAAELGVRLEEVSRLLDQSLDRLGGVRDDPLDAPADTPHSAPADGSHEWTLSCRCPSARMLTQNASAARISGQLVVPLDALNDARGRGERERAERLAGEPDRPTGPSRPSAVTVVTPVQKWPSTKRKAVGSAASYGSDISPCAFPVRPATARW